MGARIPVSSRDTTLSVNPAGAVAAAVHQFFIISNLSQWLKLFSSALMTTVTLVVSSSGYSGYSVPRWSTACMLIRVEDVSCVGGIVVSCNMSTLIGEKS